MADLIAIEEATNNLEEEINTSDRESVNKARKKASRTRADRLHFVQAAMTTTQGRSWFYDLMVRCRVVSTPFTGDPYETAFKCGMQNIGLQVLDDIQTASPEGYTQMMKENK